MAVKYSGILKFADEIKAEIDLAADGTVEKAVVIDGDGVETPIGGGGSSDFTTAEVTITNNTGSHIQLALPVAEDNNRSHILRTYVAALKNSSESNKIALYKGEASGRIITNNVPSPVCTGDVSIGVVDNSTITITGNGTITFGTASEG